MVTQILNGYEIFTDKAGKPLDGGYILIGEYGLNPISNPKTAYWDEALTIPAVNIRTTGGYPVYNGSPGRLYASGSYSLLVKDRAGAVVYTQLFAYEEEGSYGDPIDPSLGDVLFLDGSPSLKTNTGILPVLQYGDPAVDYNVALYVASQAQSGNEMVDNPLVKWPGKRGVWDFASDPLNLGNLTYAIELINSGFTIELWAKYDGNSILFALSNGVDDTNRIELSASSGQLRLSTTTDNNGSALSSEWTHIKLVARNDFTLDVYVNGVEDVSGVALGSSDYTDLTYLSIGNNTIFATGDPWAGLITDFRYAPYVDEALDHYDADLPWTDPNSEYGENGIYKVNEEVGILTPTDGGGSGDTILIGGGGGDGKSLQTDGTMGVTAVAGTPMYFDTSGELQVASADSLASTLVAGILVEDTDAAGVGTVQAGGLLEVATWALTPGTRYYLGEDGAIVDSSGIDDTFYQVFLGVAVTSTTMDVAVGLPEWTGRQGNGKIVGEMFKLPVYTSIPGALPFSFDNAVKKALYPELYNRVGDVFEAMHVAAGDSASAADEFYPTPIPGYYERTGLPDWTFTETAITTGTGNITLLPSAQTWLTNLRDGSPLKFVVESGTPPAELSDGQIVYCRFNTTQAILYQTEANSIAGTSGIVFSTAGSGTFRLTQEGVRVGDSFQGHWHEITLSSETPNAGAFRVDTVTGAYTGNGFEHIRDAITDTVNGTPRTSNETRPSTLYEFGYIQAESTLPSGETVSALRYDTGWVANSDWTGVNLIVEHNLNSSLKDLVVDVFVSSTGVDTDVVRLGGASISASDSGYSVKQTDYNTIRIATSANGVPYINSAFTTTLLDTEAWYYRIVITKPNIIATVTPVPTRSITTNYTFTGLEETINCDMASGTLTVDSGLPIGTKFTSRKINSGAGTITTLFTGGETITRAALPSVTHTSEGDSWTYEKVATNRWELTAGVEKITSSGLTYKKDSIGDVSINGQFPVVFSGVFSQIINVTMDITLTSIIRVVGSVEVIGEAHFFFVGPRTISTSTVTYHAYDPTTSRTGTYDLHVDILARWYT